MSTNSEILQERLYCVCSCNRKNVEPFSTIESCFSSKCLALRCLNAATTCGRDWTTFSAWKVTCATKEMLRRVVGCLSETLPWRIVGRFRTRISQFVGRREERAALGGMRKSEYICLCLKNKRRNREIRHWRSTTMFENISENVTENLSEK